MKTKEEFTQAIIESCQEKIPQISSFNTGSIFRLFIELVASFLEKLSLELDNLMPQRFVQSATGNWLDLKAEELSIVRYPTTKTQGYVVFHRKNTDQNVTIEKGKIVSSNEINGKYFRYIVINSQSFAQDSLSCSVLVEAEEFGSEYNLPSNTITQLSTSIAGIDFVNNPFRDWITSPGTNLESDESLRERCLSLWKGLNSANIFAYESWVKSIEGIGSVKIIPTPNNEMGRVDVICTGIDNIQASLELLNKVQDELEYIKPIATDIQVKNTIEIPIDLSIHVTSINNNKPSIELSIQEFFTKFDIGQNFEPSALIGNIFTLEDIISVNIQNHSNTIFISSYQIARLGSLEITIENQGE